MPADAGLNCQQTETRSMASGGKPLYALWTLVPVTAATAGSETSGCKSIQRRMKTSQIILLWVISTFHEGQRPSLHNPHYVGRVATAGNRSRNRKRKFANASRRRNRQ